MRKEVNTLLLGLGAVAGAVALSQGAFSFDVRQKMFVRDQGECQSCGKRFRDGWLLDCSHDDHDHSKDTYNDVNNGRVLCLDDHLAYHVAIGDKNGQFLIRRRIQETHGGHTRAWIEQHVRG